MTRKHRRATTKPQPAPTLKPGEQPTEHVVVRDDDNRLHAVERVIDTIAAMFARRQISTRQQMAAQHYREAWDALHSGMPCALDRSRTGGGTTPGSPGEWKLWGTGRVAEARRILGPIDASICWAICGEGLTIADTTLRMIPRGAGQDERYIGTRFRDALSLLADHWVHELKAGRITGTGRFEDFDPALTGTDAAGMGKVAVAGRVQR